MFLDDVVSGLEQMLVERIIRLLQKITICVFFVKEPIHDLFLEETFFAFGRYLFRQIGLDKGQFSIWFIKLN